MKKFLLTALLLFVCSSAVAYDFMVDGMCFTITGSNPNTVKVVPEKMYAETSSWNRSPNLSGDVVVPQSVNYNNKSYTVTSIDDYAFYHSKITSITIPASVLYIGRLAIAYNTIQSVTFEGNSQLQTIGDCAFYLTPISSITLPNSVTNLGVNVFQLCSYLQSATLPANITQIPSCTFYYCTSLKSVKNTGNVTSIGGRAFLNCPSLVSFTISDKVTTIADSAFCRTGLTSVTIPSSVTSIGKFVFCDAASLTSAVIKNSVMGRYQFSGCSSLSSVTWSGNVTTIPECAFASTAFPNVTLPNTITTIGTSAFRGCKMTSLTIPSSVTTIDELAFYDCSNLSSVTVPATVTSVGRAVFKTCPSLKTADIQNSSICMYQFNECGKLETITMGEALSTIEDYAFAGCSSLVNVNFNNSNFGLLKKIANYNTQLKNVVFGESVTAIGASACQNWSGLKSVTFPAGTTSIGNSAFSGCTNLRDVYALMDRPIRIDPSVFNGVETHGYCDLHVPEGSSGRYKAFDVWKEFYMITEDAGQGGQGSGVYGDVNGDGVVNVTDVNIVVSIILNQGANN